MSYSVITLYLKNGTTRTFLEDLSEPELEFCVSELIYYNEEIKMITVKRDNEILKFKSD